MNYIEPLAQDSTEMNIAGMLSDADGAFLYDYAVDKEIKGISFELAVYKKGVLESESSLGTISWSELEQISLRNGMIAVIPDFQNFRCRRRFRRRSRTAFGGPAAFRHRRIVHRIVGCTG